ncbi:hypothetical protein GLW08_20350 [Pontibacillus yanchengensis]|uniref:Uncharacterized protein n=2 Tax=Pontibacillus yanchengensis TaxID=462910 RepID=A0ACC7VLQ3_9BACI|nr:DUF6094 domain-containing protein [Pontibacillus yanchengensis]MYL35457.1 hypothetical protein [Pontibacillus yanchengensis]MYL55657.1 hypothetical protein [Pontibacillus yanchengensis]
MARIASQSKGGFYATPLTEIEKVLPHMQFEQEDDESLFNIIDPCAGEGEALERFMNQGIRQQADIMAYGVELEESRAKTASTILDYTLNESYSNVRTERKFGMMWLNPPYDEIFNERTELRFLRTLTSKSKGLLIDEGLLCFCVPQYVLGVCANVLAGRFHDVKVYRFSDEEYPTFKQVILFAKFGKAKRDERKDTLKHLRDIAQQGPEALATLDEMEESFMIPSSKDQVNVFRAGKLNPEELKQDLQQSAAFLEFDKKVTPQSTQSSMQNPLLPLKHSHAGIAVASGAIGGNMGNHIVVGVTKQLTEKEEQKDEESNRSKEIYTKHHKSIVRVFTQDGIHELQ